MRERRGPGSVGSSGSTREMGFEVSEQERGREGAERARAHLASLRCEMWELLVIASVAPSRLGRTSFLPSSRSQHPGYGAQISAQHAPSYPSTETQLPFIAALAQVSTTLHHADAPLHSRSKRIPRRNHLCLSCSWRFVRFSCRVWASTPDRSLAVGTPFRSLASILPGRPPPAAEASRSSPRDAGGRALTDLGRPDYLPTPYGR